jgi:hypothetical protein
MSGHHRATFRRTRLRSGWMLVLFGLAALPAQAAEGPAFAWPQGQRAAVSLAYDDALESQLDHAIPALDRLGLKGSFYLQLSREPVLKRLPEWRAAARNGHELGNHSLFHQCSGSAPDRDWVEPQRDLDTTTAAQMRDQLILANGMLHAIDGRHARTLTVPCGDTLAAGENYIEQVKQEFVAIKLGHGGVTADMARLDPYAVSVAVPVDASGADLIALAEDAARRGTMVNYTFHGVGGDYLSVTAQAHAELLAHLARHPERYWVATFIDIMTYVREQPHDR